MTEAPDPRLVNLVENIPENQDVIIVIPHNESDPTNYHVRALALRAQGFSVFVARQASPTKHHYTVRSSD